MFFKWLNERIKTLTWVHVMLIEFGAFFFGLFLAKIWPGLLGLNTIWYFILFILAEIIPCKKIFLDKD